MWKLVQVGSGWSVRKDTWGGPIEAVFLEGWSSEHLDQLQRILDKIQGSGRG